VVALFDVATGRELAVLETPHAAGIFWLAFSPDGDRLAVAHQNHTTYLWDLRAVRRQLAEMGLDLDLPPYPPQKVAPTTRVEVNLGNAAGAPPLPPQEVVKRCTAALETDADDVEAHHLRAHAYERLGRYADAASDFSAALKRRPKDPHFLTCRGEAYRLLDRHAEAVADCRKSLEVRAEQAGPNATLAWIHANGPAPFRDPRKALPFAQRAVALEPKVSRNHHALGLAYYRLGRWKEAVRSFERGLELRGGQTTAYYDFFLAMCHARLGDPAKAKDCFDRAVKWVGGQKDLPAEFRKELKAFRAEAEELLRNVQRAK
jgi:tetratricopeptide (TPR) repeat protein